MKLSTKIKKSWWVLLSFIPLCNGVGFVYIGHKTNNRNWLIEGLIYEVPWFFSIIYAYNEDFLGGLAIFALILMLVSIIRSILVARRLIKAYEFEEKRTFLNNSFYNSDDDKSENVSYDINKEFSAKNTNNSKNTTFTTKSKTISSNKISGTKSTSSGDWKACCLCLIGIFIILGFISIL